MIFKIEINLFDKKKTCKIKIYIYKKIYKF